MVKAGGQEAPPRRSEQRIEPFLLSVLSHRLEAIGREMVNTVMKASRSAVIKNSRDMSCGLLTYDHRLLCVEDVVPVHVIALELTTMPITEFFDDIKEGDAYINNCPYTGATHHADITVCVPVFCDGEPLFWALSRSHHADIGAPIPSTYLPEAATIYEEGVHLPCVRVQENFKDKNDIIRMCRTKIRVGEIWYGDYLAQIGACRTAERRLKELVERYGKETIKAFIEDWMDYGERSAIAEIEKLPKGTWSYETCHDPVPGVVDDGVPVKVSVTVDPDAGEVTVDARDNIDCVPGGINLSEACASASCRIGVFYNLDASIPHNQGSASRINVLLRDGCVVGRPKYPAGTSVATTNVNARLITAVTCCFAQIGQPYGMGEFAYSQSSGEAVISGADPRKDDHPYVNQVFLAYGSGPGLQGHDGWLLSGAACDGGQMRLDSIEIDESMYPIIVTSRQIAKDTLGPGEWDGGPALEGEFGPLAGEMTAFWGSDGDVAPPRGVLDGMDSACSSNWKRPPQRPAREARALRLGCLPAGRDAALRDLRRGRIRRSVIAPPGEGCGGSQSRVDQRGTRRDRLQGDAQAGRERGRLRGRRGCDGGHARRGRTVGVSMAFDVCIDIGGTFTDCVITENRGEMRIFKSPTTPDQFARGVMDVLDLAAGHYGHRADDLPGERGLHRPRHHGLHQRPGGGEDRARGPDLQQGPPGRAHPAGGAAQANLRVAARLSRALRAAPPDLRGRRPHRRGRPGVRPAQRRRRARRHRALPHHGCGGRRGLPAVVHRQQRARGPGRRDLPAGVAGDAGHPQPPAQPDPARVPAHDLGRDRRLAAPPSSAPTWASCATAWRTPASARSFCSPTASAA